MPPDPTRASMRYLPSSSVPRYASGLVAPVSGVPSCTQIRTLGPYDVPHAGHTAISIGDLWLEPAPAAHARSLFLRLLPRLLHRLGSVLYRLTKGFVVRRAAARYSDQPSELVH